jgi:hypothetical protein
MKYEQQACLVSWVAYLPRLFPLSVRLSMHIHLKYDSHRRLDRGNDCNRLA